jgi:hypothetical protein
MPLSPFLRHFRKALGIDDDIAAPVSTRKGKGVAGGGLSRSGGEGGEGGGNAFNFLRIPPSSQFETEEGFSEGGLSGSIGSMGGSALSLNTIPVSAKNLKVHYTLLRLSFPSLLG